LTELLKNKNVIAFLKHGLHAGVLERERKCTDQLFLKLQSAFWQFQTITVPECRLIKLLPYILFEKYIYILALEM